MKADIKGPDHQHFGYFSSSQILPKVKKILRSKKIFNFVALDGKDTTVSSTQRNIVSTQMCGTTLETKAIISCKKDFQDSSLTFPGKKACLINLGMSF